MLVKVVEGVEVLKGSSVSKLSVLLLLLSTVILVGCSSIETRPNAELLNHLTNQGPIKLSTDNPFLAGNLFLAKEMEVSQDLAGFINHRGSPTVLEIEDNLWGGLNLTFYYPKDNQHFTLRPIKDSWIINGPFPIEGSVSAATQLEEDSKPDPSGNESMRARPILLEQQAERGLSAPQAALVSYNNTSPVKPMITSVTARQSKTKGYESVLPEGQAAGESKPDLEIDNPNQDKNQERITNLKAIQKQLTGSLAELTPKGDLVHHVSLPQEDLELIVEWYTHDPSNSAPIARINKLTPKTPLKEGESLIIPSYFVKNKKRLSEDALAMVSVQLNKASREPDDHLEKDQTE